MLLQTNSYVVPKEKRAEHQRVVRRFRQTLKRLGCDHFEVYEQVGANWASGEASGRYVQILRFTDRKHQLAVQQAERSDPQAQAVIAEFCDLINFPYQQQQGLFAVGFYTAVLPIAPLKGGRAELVSTVEHEVVDDGQPDEPTAEAAPEPPPAATAGLSTSPPRRPRSATVERHHEMIDSVTIDGPLTGAGELFDVLEADAPVDGLDGTPPETVPLLPVADTDTDADTDADGLDVAEIADVPHASNGFLLDDVAAGPGTGSKRPTGM